MVMQRGRRKFWALAVAVAAAACTVQSPELGTTNEGDPGAYTPANPSYSPDGSTALADAGSDGTAGDAAPGDASPSDAAMDVSEDASIGGNCAAETFCSGYDLVTHTPGRIFCSKIVTSCAYGCTEGDGGAQCAQFDPASCPLGVPYVVGSLCHYSASNLCFETKQQACDCIGCPFEDCTVGGRLKLPFKKKDGGLVMPPLDAGSFVPRAVKCYSVSN